MNAIALGPLLISTPRLYALGVALMLLVSSRYLLGLSTQQHTRWFNGLLLVWLLGARAVFVILHWESYSQAPLDALKLWQPGFNALGGMVAGLVWTAWALRERLLAMLGGLAMTVGAASLWLVLVTLAPLGPSFAVASVPDITLEDLDGNPVNLASLDAQGDLLMVNLWPPGARPASAKCRCWKPQTRWRGSAWWWSTRAKTCCPSCATWMNSSWCFVMHYATLVSC